MVLIRTKIFRRKSWVCRVCGARQGGDPKKERTICSCSEEAYEFTATRFLDREGKRGGCICMSKQLIWKTTHCRARAVYACGLVARAHGADNFEATRRCDLVHGRLCDRAEPPMFGPERRRETPGGE